MTIAVAALAANGTTTIRNVESWRVKETDRLAAMATELRKVGASVVETQDSISVTPPAQLTRQCRNRHLRRPPHGDVLLAGGAAAHPGGDQRPQMRGQDLPGLFRGTGQVGRRLILPTGLTRHTPCLASWPTGGACIKPAPHSGRGFIPCPSSAFCGLRSWPCNTATGGITTHQTATSTSPGAGKTARKPMNKNSFCTAKSAKLI